MKTKRSFFTLLTLPLTYMATWWLKLISGRGYHEKVDQIFMKLRVLPLLDHYYAPLINPKKELRKSLREDRNLVGIDLNVAEQLSVLQKFKFNEELEGIPLEKPTSLAFYYNNGSYCSGDAEYLYNMIRHFKPKRIIEIGSGNSTLMAINALEENKKQDVNYNCEHICIEPYEMPWLEKTGVKVIREKVESLDMDVFRSLGENDILFIDSSHIIRPQGDVLFEFLEILPNLNSGVLVHVHDIFSPKDYLDEWIYKRHYLWNEQYLLEAFLCFNSEFRVIGALNYLSHNYTEEFSKACPIFAKQKDREPGAFWIVKK